MTSFSTAFAAARKVALKGGPKTFKWRGRLFSTKLRKDAAPSKSPSPTAKRKAGTASKSRPMTFKEKLVGRPPASKAGDTRKPFSGKTPRSKRVWPRVGTRGPKKGEGSTMSGAPAKAPMPSSAPRAKAPASRPAALSRRMAPLTSKRPKRKPRGPMRPIELR